VAKKASITKEEEKKEEKIAEVVEELKIETPVTVEKEVKEEVVLKVEKPKVEAPVSKIEKEASKITEKPVSKKVGSAKLEETPVEITSENAEAIKTKYKKLDGPKITGKTIDLKQFEKPKKKKPDPKTATSSDPRKKRKRITKPAGNTSTPRGPVRRAVGNNRGPGNNRPGFKGGRGNQRPAAVKKRRTNRSRYSEASKGDLRKASRKVF
jgi:translation initiation factor IF-2